MDKDGSYIFYIFWLVVYFSGVEFEYIYIFIKELNINEYYIDDFVFDDDFFLIFKKCKVLFEWVGFGIVVFVLDE